MSFRCVISIQYRWAGSPVRHVLSATRAASYTSASLMPEGPDHSVKLLPLIRQRSLLCRGGSCRGYRWRTCSGDLADRCVPLRV
jgi:hypothetical protein